jgi:hypothetical protein
VGDVLTPDSASNDNRQSVPRLRSVRTKDASNRLSREAEHQDRRMQQALAGELELRDRFYFINRAANARFEELLEGLTGKRVVVVGSSDCGVTPLARR